MKILAIIGITFFLYCSYNVFGRRPLEWTSYEKIRRTLWFIIIAAGTWFCVHLLLK